MILRAFGYELTLLKQDTLESVRHKHYTKAKENALRGLVDSQLQLAHQQNLYNNRESQDYSESQIKGLENAIEEHKRGIHNWNSQLKVLESLTK